MFAAGVAALSCEEGTDASTTWGMAAAVVCLPRKEGFAAGCAEALLQNTTATIGCWPLPGRRTPWPQTGVAGMKRSADQGKGMATNLASPPEEHQVLQSEHLKMGAIG